MFKIKIRYFSYYRTVRVKIASATAEIPAKIRQENENLTQKFYNEVQKLSGDISTLRCDTESKVQEATRTIESVSNALIERTDAHMVDSKKMTEGLSQEVEELRLEYSLFKGQINLEQKTWQNQTGGELDKVNDSVRLVEDRVAEMQAETRHKIQKANAEIVYFGNN